LKALWDESINIIIHCSEAKMRGHSSRNPENEQGKIPPQNDFWLLLFFYSLLNSTVFGALDLCDDS